ncbi:uncharacterized protein HMPREF1541_07888 [Cyphellophora europaea CBS 101466]|uniref:Cystathionine gamma-synthase n=1 Tax=Cyphellophora europaea (strain CBS 101466) TaxID=1220924 RepID=W2RKC1_CYPE1|nr:uncharacterized protein HMPREF1541_07888 [Cyphellophora europaea CBS 101466]ETN36901.1 hypothetical protein HMPREF1541_07888 [Cyphellophora europaea CBS 101466]
MLFTHPTSVAALVDWASSPERKDNMVPREAFTIRAFSLGPQRLWVAFVPADANMKIQGFWMHPGVGISTRQAQEAFSHIDVLEEIQVDSEVLAIPLEAETIYAALRERIIGIVNRAPLSTSNRPTSSDVYLFPTGMASIYRLHQLLLRTSPGPTVVFGFTFHSTQHLFEDFHPPDAPFLNLGNADAADLATLRTYLADLASQGKTIQALWTEFPSNPNCVTPDIAALRALADQYGFPLIIDDTVASPANVDVMPYADITITSLTKSFSGYSDVMGGSLILNPSSRLYNHFHTLLATHYHNGLHHADAAVLLANSADFLSRSAIHNRNTAALAGLLATSPLITEVYHPLHLPDSRPHYEASMRPPTEDFTPGYGLLLSVEFVSLTALTAFYDALDIYKSPHLGGHVTLALPYM